MNETVRASKAGPGLPVLKGFRVLRLGRSPAGDFLGRILEDAGASVQVYDAGSPSLDLNPDIVINDLGRGAPVPDGFDFDTMARASSDLVYCSLVSFPANGPTGLPELEDDPILALMGVNRVGGRVPEREPLRIPSFYGAQMAAIYIACGLMPRNRRGRALHIEVPLFSVALNILVRQMIRFDDPRLKDPQDVNFMLPVATNRKCADGRYIQPQGRYPGLIRILFTAAGHPEWADAAVDGLEYLPDRAAYDMWNRRMDEMFLARPAAEWERIINAAGGSCTLSRSYQEWVAEEHPHISGIFQQVEGGGLEVGPGVVLEEGPRAADSGPDLPAADASATERRPLDGIRVLDFSIIIAGPAMGRILADLGADVVRIDSPDRVVNPVLWMDLNRGKRSLVLDLGRPEARDIARRLARDVHVIVENFRVGKLAALGLGYEEISQTNPGVVYTSGNLFDLTGPWAGRPGWDHNAQAATGMQLARARNGEPRHMPLPVNDFGTGLFGALGTVLGLLHRELTGHGVRVAVSLARSASFLQQMNLVDRHPISPPAIAGTTIACSDGWVTAYQSSGDTAAPPSVDGAETLSTAAVLARLAQSGIPASVENTTPALVAGSLLDDVGLRVRWTHPEFGPMSQAIPAGRMSGFSLAPRSCAPSPGADNAAILAEAGMGERLEEFQAAGMVGTFPLFGQRRWAGGAGIP